MDIAWLGLKVRRFKSSHVVCVQINSADVVFSGALYVIVEYCAFGCLRNYLIKNRDGFVDTMDYSIEITPMKKPNTSISIECASDDDRQSNEYVNSTNQRNQNSAGDYLECLPQNGALPLTTKDLICFTFQIARGMEYLSSRNVSEY